MRLIDADALIAEYDKVHVGPAGGTRKLMEDAPTIKPESNCSEFPNNWIPTSKERPPQHQEIWITDDLGTVELVYGKAGIWWLDDNYYIESEIIAWMPANVPEPYKPEEEAE